MMQFDEPMEKYHGERKHLSKSGIDLLLKSQRHFWDRYINRQSEYIPTAAQSLGTIIHEMLLEPKIFEGKYVCGPEGANRTHKIFKEVAKENKDKEVLPHNEWQKLMRIKESALTQYESKTLLEFGGKNEVSCYWTDENTGQGLKTRPDRLILDQRICIDLKTTEDAEKEKFVRKAADFGYHRSVAMTTRGLKKVTDDDYIYLFLVVETKPPFNVAVFRYDEEAIDVANREIDRGIVLYQEAIESNTWKGYPKGIQQLWLPPWKAKVAL